MPTVLEPEDLTAEQIQALIHSVKNLGKVVKPLYAIISVLVVGLAGGIRAYADWSIKQANESARAEATRSSLIQFIQDQNKLNATFTSALGQINEESKARAAHERIQDKRLNLLDKYGTVLDGQ